MEIHYIFMLFGVFMTVSVVIALIKIIKGRGLGINGQSAANTGTDEETARLCDTLDGDNLFEIAKSLEDGKGYKKDYKKWLAYMTAAADKGFAPAQRELGLYYKYENNTLAIDYLKRAVDSGDGEAAAELAKIYSMGISGGTPKIEKNYDLALQIVKPFAEQGSLAAQKKCAELLYYNFDDEDGAAEWYKKAAEQGDAESMCELADIYSFKDDYQKVEEYYLKAAQLGSAEAECSLGNLYCDIKEDYESALNWYKKASEHGYSFATCRIGEMYLNGEGVLCDKYKAFEYFEKAAEDSFYGQYFLGKCYFDGSGTEQNYAKAIEIWKKAAEYNSDSQYALGLCYLNGEGVKKNVGKAVEYLKKASDTEEDAAYKLGEIYYEGNGVKKDENAAKEYWRIAARRGNDDAKESLKLYFGETD